MRLRAVSYKVITWESETVSKIRGFEPVIESMREPKLDPIMPKRATRHSAAYDLFAITDGSIMPGQKAFFPTNVKAYMQTDEVLHIHPRSSQGIKQDVILANTIGVIDSDYYGNPNNDGHIGVYLRNLGKSVVFIQAGDRIAQAEFQKVLLADGDEGEGLSERQGGVGSTGR